jgi:hypothetical protein
LVIGYQPGKVTFADGITRTKGEMCLKFDGLIFLIHVGMSEAIDYSHGALLHISGGKGGQVVAIFPEGDSLDLWKRVGNRRCGSEPEAASDHRIRHRPDLRW